MCFRYSQAIYHGKTVKILQVAPWNCTCRVWNASLCPWLFCLRICLTLSAFSVPLPVLAFCLEAAQYCCEVWHDSAALLTSHGPRPVLCQPNIAQLPPFHLKGPPNTPPLGVMLTQKHSYLHAGVDACIHTHTYIHTHMHTHPSQVTYIHTYIHTYTHTHTTVR